MTRSTSEQLFHFTDDLEVSLNYNPARVFDCDNIVLCGVGGSAVSGYFAYDCCFQTSKKPVRLIRYPALPSWTDGSTLAIVSSYSGNTAETMEMYRQAKERGCTVSVVTSGGALKAAAESAGDHIALLPEGMHPRHAIGYMIGYTLAIMRAAGCTDMSSDIRAIIPSLRKYRDSIIADNGQARHLADRFMGRVPVICAESSMASVAFCESIPLFGEHAARGWAAGTPEEFILVMLNGTSASPMGDLAAALREGGCDVETVELGGKTSLENMFRAIILGDYVSMFMAEARGIDPAEVRPVMQMKEKLSQRIA